MANKLNKIEEKYSALSSREKWMILILAWGGLLFLAYSFFINPTLESIKKHKSVIAANQTTIAKKQVDLAEITAKLNVDPNEELDEEIAELTAESQDFSDTISKIVRGLVSPNDMAALLETVLNQTHNLKLISLESQPLEPIRIEGANPEDEQNIGYYIHPVKIVLSGKYFDIQKYLATLEQMPVKYYWRSIDYHVEEYPNANLELVVYTLGERQEFIGG